jgi:hypothetical protein
MSSGSLGGSAALQLLTIVGSIIGIFTGIFVLTDRLFRRRPIAFVVLKGTSHNAHRYVRVKNIGMTDVIIHDIKAWPKTFEISKGHSVREIAGAITDMPAVSILAPDEVWDFPFFPHPKRPDEKDYDGKIRFAVCWRKASATWLWQIPVFVFTSVRDLEKLESALD